MVVAARTSDYQSPLLSQNATGTALSVLVHDLAVNLQAGLVTRGQPGLTPQVTGLMPQENPTTVTISDCVDDSHWLDYKENGALADNAPGGRHATTATVADNNGIWMVTQLAIQASGTC
jgi:hypothetical protein